MDMINITIEKAELKFKNSIMTIIESAKSSLRNIGIEQWSNKYPEEIDIENDIKSNSAFIVKLNSNPVGYLYIGEECTDYLSKSCKWKIGRASCRERVS